MSDTKTNRGPDGESTWLRRFAALCWARPGAVVLTVAGAVLGAGLATVLPLITRHVVDDIIVPGRGSVTPWVLLLLLLAAAQFGASFMRRWWAGKVQWGVERDLRTRLHDALHRIDGRRLDRIRSGDLLSRAVNDVSVVKDLTGSLPDIARNTIALLAALIVMLVLSPLLALVALVMVPVMALVARRAVTRTYPVDRVVQERTSTAAEAVEANLDGVRVVKGFAQEDAELDRYGTLARALYAARLHSRRLAAGYSGMLGELLPGAARFGVVLAGGLLAVNGHISLGTFIAFLSYLGAMMYPIHSMASVVIKAQEARSGLVRIFELVDAGSEVTERPDAVELPGTAAPAVDFDTVRFAYESDADPVLDGLNLRIEPGETLALVGLSGSGKSTLAGLPARLRDPDGGAVRIDGHDLRELRLASLRHAIGTVLDGGPLFSASVRDNIRFGRPDADEQQVRAAARAAQADGFIEELTEGYDTVLGERGHTLSGGQRQRIALARALLTDPRLMILDDATSAVDAKVEAAIHGTLRGELRDRTVLIVANRPGTVRLADRIAVLDGGRIIDTGTHEALAERCPRYRELLLGEEPAEGAVLRVPGPRKAEDAQEDLHKPAADSPVPAAEPDVDEASARAAAPNFTLRAMLRPYRLGLLGIAVLLISDAVALAVVPDLVRVTIDRGVAGRDTTALVLLSLALMGVTVFNWLVFRGEIRLIARVGERVLYELRMKMFAQLQRLGLDYFERESGGKAVTRMVNDVGTIGEFLNHGLLDIVVSGVLFLGVIVMMLTIDVGLTLTMLLVLPVLALACWWYARVSDRQYTRAREHLGTVNAAFQESVRGVRVTQAFSRQGHSSALFADLAEQQRKEQMRSQRYSALFFALVEFLSDAATALIIGVGAGRVADGSITTGAIVAFLLYVVLAFSPIRAAAPLLDVYQRARVALARCRELLVEQPTVDQGTGEDGLSERAAPTGELVLDDVHYSYAGGRSEAIRGISVRIPAGQTVAVVGETGAGKSTLLKLVARLYLPTDGTLRVDGEDLRTADGIRYRRRLGFVPQEPYLFGATVHEAIAYGRPGADLEQVRAAAEAVGAHRMIDALPDGYGHELADRGRNLSDGQQQLIALARARLVDPDILLLDEATAALDLATEAAVARAVDTLTTAPTTLVIAHRLSTARRADRILVMDGGRLVEDGRHEELVADGGVYAGLWEAYEASAVSEALAVSEASAVTGVGAAEGGERVAVG